MALIGDTVRLRVRFRTFKGTAVEPTDIKLRILDGNDLTVVESVDIPSEVKVDVGVYEYDYIVPEGDSEKLVYEFSGIYNSKPILSRGSFDRTFI